MNTSNRILEPFDAEQEILNDYPILSKLVPSDPSIYFNELFSLYNCVQSREEEALSSENIAELISDSPTCDELEEIAVILIDGQPSPNLVEAVGYYLLRQATEKRVESINRKKRGRPGNQFSFIEKSFFMEVVFELKYVQKKTWKETADAINNSNWKKDRPVKHSTLQREYRKFKADYSFEVKLWEESGTSIDLETLK